LTARVASKCVPIQRQQRSIVKSIQEWRYEAVRLASSIQTTAIIRKIPLSEALSQAVDTLGMTFSDDSQFASFKYSYAGSVASSTSTQFTGNAEYSERPSLQTRYGLFSPRKTFNHLDNGTRVLHQLRDVLENSDLSNCWDDMAGVLLWIVLTVSAASKKSEDKMLRRYFSALTVRVSMFLWFEHAEALHATLLKMADINEALRKKSYDPQVTGENEYPARKRMKA
jgi:hypothetical protein